MSDDGDTVRFTFPPFTFTGSIPPFFTRSRRPPTPTFPPETPTDFPTSTPSPSVPFDVSSLQTLTETDDPTVTDVFPSSTGTLDTPTPTSEDPDSSTTDTSPSVTLSTDPSSSTLFSFDSSLTIDPSTSDLSFPTSTPDFTTSTFSDDPFSSSQFDTSLTTDPSSTSDLTFTTSQLSLTTSSPSSTPTSSATIPVSSITTTPGQSSSFPVLVSRISSSRSSPSTVTTTSFPSFGGGASPQSAASNTSTGTIVAATTGALALAIVLALLAIICKKRRLRNLRRQMDQDPFFELDLDGETAAVNQPLIVGDGPGPAGAAYSEPFTDDPRQRSQSRSFSATTGPPPSLTRSNHSFQAVAGSTPTPDPRGNSAVSYHNQLQPANRRSPPPVLPPSAVTRARSSQVQTKIPPESPILRQSSPSFDAGAIAYLRHNDQATDASPPSPGQLSPGNADEHRLISAFSASSGLSPRHSNPVPPPKIDEMWKNSPDPVQASLSYAPPINRWGSFTPSVSGHVHDPGDTIVIGPVDALNHGPPPPPPINTGQDEWNPYNIRDGNFNSRPSPIAETTEPLSHSQEGSNNSGGTWGSNPSMDSSASMPVVLQAQRVRLTPTVLSLVTPPSPSEGSHYEDSPVLSGPNTQVPPVPPLPPLPPFPVLPQVLPLSLGKKRSAQGGP